MTRLVLALFLVSVFSPHFAASAGTEIGNGEAFVCRDLTGSPAFVKFRDLYESKDPKEVSFYQHAVKSNKSVQTWINEAVGKDGVLQALVDKVLFDFHNHKEFTNVPDANDSGDSKNVRGDPFEFVLVRVIQGVKYHCRYEPVAFAEYSFHHGRIIYNFRRELVAKMPKVDKAALFIHEASWTDYLDNQSRYSAEFLLCRSQLESLAAYLNQPANTVCLRRHVRDRFNHLD